MINLTYVGLFGINEILCVFFLSHISEESIKIFSTLVTLSDFTISAVMVELFLQYRALFLKTT